MEIRSLLLLNLVLLCFYALGLAIVYWVNPALKSIRWLIPAFAAGASATLVLEVCGPQESCFVLVNVLVLGACALLHQGVRELTGARSGWPAIEAVLLSVQALGGLYFGLRGHVALRILLFSALLAIQLLLSAGLLLAVMRSGFPEGLRVPAGMLMVILLGAAASSLVRSGLSLLALLHPARSPVPLPDGGNVLLAILFSATTLFGFCWMSTESLRLDLEQMARTDSLTGVLNRRAFEAEFMREISRTLRSGAPLSLLLMDVDHFKIVNDEHGHAAGDAVLRELASILQRDLRRADLVARLGGEEFAALLPDTDADRATHTAERLRAVIEKAQISAGGARMRVTASFGVTAWQGDTDAWDRLLERVDSAMYQAKQAGRNRVQMV